MNTTIKFGARWWSGEYLRVIPTFGIRTWRCPDGSGRIGVELAVEWLKWRAGAWTHVPLGYDKPTRAEQERFSNTVLGQMESCLVRAYLEAPDETPPPPPAVKEILARARKK